MVVVGAPHAHSLCACASVKKCGPDATAGHRVHGHLRLARPLIFLCLVTAAVWLNLRTNCPHAACAFNIDLLSTTVVIYVRMYSCPCNVRAEQHNKAHNTRLICIVKWLGEAKPASQPAMQPTNPGQPASQPG